MPSDAELLQLLNDQRKRSDELRQELGRRMELRALAERYRTDPTFHYKADLVYNLMRGVATSPEDEIEHLAIARVLIALEMVEQHTAELRST